MRVKVKATDLLSACNEAKPYTKARGLVVDTAIVLRRDAGGPLRVSAGSLHRVTTAIDWMAKVALAAPSVFAAGMSFGKSPDRRSSVRHVERRHTPAPRGDAFRVGLHRCLRR